jgi:glycosyltransferase involved in cell wall biosynthesis
MAVPESRQHPGILHLDSDSGQGGASRSMLFSVEALDRGRWRPVVVARTGNPLIERYRELGVEVVAVPELPTFRPSERKSWVLFLRYLWKRHARKRVLQAVRESVGQGQLALVHVNHENLALTGLWLARELGLPAVCHIRTLLFPSAWARWVYRLIATGAKRVVCIAEPVKEHFLELTGAAGGRARLEVISNRGPSGNEVFEPLAEFTEPADALRVISLSNFSPNRGVDQIVDVAAALSRRGRRDVVFFLCGRAAHTKVLSGKGTDYFGSIVARVEQLGLQDMVRFPGFIPEPLRALQACHALIRLNRVLPSPWGRDIIESMTLGVPVVTIGRYQGFVEHGVNGFMHGRFDAEAVADDLLKLRDDPALWERMAEANRDKARRIFSPAAHADALNGLYQSILSGN